MADTAHSAGDSDVVVTLVATGRTQAGIAERRITLTRMEPTARVGRSSKVPAKACLAAENNAWFETPVMSREHAELTANFDEKMISLKDVGSLHGSFVRHKATPQTEERVYANTSVRLGSGDQIRFGMDIHRHHEKYPPCIVNFNSTWHELPEQGKKSPNTFSVPYGSDDEDQASDTDSVVMMEQSLPGITKGPATKNPATTKSPVNTIDLTTTKGKASPQHLTSFDPARIIDLTAEPDLGSDVSMTGRHSPVTSLRRSLPTSPVAHTEPMPALVGSRTTEWTDIESEEENDSNSQASEDPEDLPLLGEDEKSINSEVSAGYTSLSEEMSDDSMSESDTGSFDDDSDAESYEDDEEDSRSYDWAATRTFGLPISTVQDTTAVLEEQNSDSFDHDMATESDEEDSVFDETSPTSIWDKKSSPLADPHESLGWSTLNPAEMQYCDTPYTQSAVPQYVPQRYPSPSDAAMVKKHAPAIEGSGSTTAQALGTKTGKFEYFEARDHNRCLAAPSSAPHAADLLNALPPKHPVPMVDFYSMPWTGDDFINRPEPTQKLESLEDRTRLQSPEPLDMTSAYTYQQSKNELRVASPDVRRIPIPDLLAEESKEPSPAPVGSTSMQEVPVVEPSARPPKRGIDGISQDMEKEAPVMESSSATISMPVEVSQRIDSQPTKRRRLVEFAACVTLGGAAVLAGLITTAPQFA